MAVPAVYDENTLAQYMSQVLGGIAGSLNWTVPNSYEELVTDAVLAYGVSDIADATDIPKLRTTARLIAWRAVMQQTAHFTDVTLPDGVRIVRNQAHAQAKEAYLVAKREAMAYGVDYNVVTVPVYSPSPFTHRTEEGVLS